MRDGTKALIPIFGIIFLGDFLNSLDASIVNVALPTIMGSFKDFGGSDGSWLIFGYALGLSALILRSTSSARTAVPRGSASGGQCFSQSHPCFADWRPVSSS